MHLENVLDKCPLFRDISQTEIHKILKDIKYSFKNYEKDSLIAIEGDECNSVGIVLDGLLEIQKIYASGKIVTLTRLQSGNIFGEVIVFSNHKKYPSNIQALQDSKVLYIYKEEIIKLSSKYMSFLENFMSLLSNRILLLNNKVKELSMESLRHKICHFLIKEYKEQKTVILKISLSRKDMAEYMGVQRPSLSRELIKMKKEGLINFDKNTITIKKLESINEYLL